jgi:hypothetical protein
VLGLVEKMKEKPGSMHTEIAFLLRNEYFFCHQGCLRRPILIPSKVFPVGILILWTPITVSGMKKYKQY